MKNRNLDHCDRWATPLDFFEQLNKEFNFNFDPCPYDWIADIHKDGLLIDWKERNFINPPYSQKLKEQFIIKALEESKKGKLCILLIPVSTSTKIFHNIIQPNAKQIRFVKGRIPFIGINSKGEYVNWHKWDKKAPDNIKRVKNSGQHDSMIVIFDGRL